MMGPRVAAVGVLVLSPLILAAAPPVREVVPPAGQPTLCCGRAELATTSPLTPPPVSRIILPADAPLNEGAIGLATSDETQEPRRLKLPLNVGMANEALANMQKTFRSFLQNGQLTQAQQIAGRLQTIPTAQARRLLLEDDLALHDAKHPRSRRATHHQVGYQPGGEIVPFTPMMTSTVGWTEAARARISFHFESTPLSDVARFFELAGGVNVHLDDGVGMAVDPQGVYVRCRNKPFEQALRVVLGSQGLGYLYADGRLIIATPARVNQLAEQLGASPSTYWSP